MKHIRLNSACHVVILDNGRSFVFGSPPEWIKAYDDNPFPSTIFLGDSILENGTNLAEVSFPMFKNFFFHNRTRTNVVAPGGKIERIHAFARESLFGPQEFLHGKGWEKAKYFSELHKITRDFDPDGERYKFDEIMEFSSYENYKFDLDGIKVKHVDKNSFNVKIGARETTISLSPRIPLESGKTGNDIKGALSLYCFDSGDGFCPNKSASSFLLNIEGNYIVFDPNIYAYDIMRLKGFDLSRVCAIFISHVHADHNQGLFKFLNHNSRIKIITGDVVSSSLKTFLRSLSGEDSADEYEIFSLKLQQDNYIDFLDASFYCDISYHSIPTVMTKIYFNQKKLSRYVFGYSGDTIYDPIILDSENFNREYGEDLLHFFDDANIIVHEAGAGLYHTDPEDLVPFLEDHQNIFWLHTFKTNKNGFSRGHILQRGDTVVFKN